jgi:predicted phage terminase large subunit-like protein
MSVTKWAPHQGPQERFLRCAAFEAFYGGAAGGGKSEALLVYPTRWVHNGNFRAIVLRRTIPELKSYLVDRALFFYRPLGATYNATERTFRFPSGARIDLGAMEHIKDRFNYDGPGYHTVAFDELSSFEEVQYTYMITRMRTTDPELPLRLRAASNPGGVGHDWVLKRFASWLYSPGEYEDEYDGPYCSPEERAAFLKPDGSNEEEQVPIGTPGSLTRVFFPATVADNPSIDEDYVTRLKASDLLTYMQKGEGNWMARPAPGLFFRRDMFLGKYLGAVPADVIMWVRHWDLAATPSDKDTGVADKGPDWTAGVLVGIRRDYTYVIADVARARVGPDEVESYVAATADLDAETYGDRKVLQVIEQEPGSAGKIAVHSMMKALRGHWCDYERPTGNKIERAKPGAAQARAGNVYLVKGTWNRVFIAEAEQFPMGKKDQIDGFSGAIGRLMKVSKKTASSGGRRQMPGRTGGY